MGARHPGSSRSSAPALPLGLASPFGLPTCSRRLVVERAVDWCPLEAAAAATAAATGSATASTVSGVAGGDDLDEEHEGFGCEIGTFGNFKKAKGAVNISVTYNTRDNDVESFVVAHGDLWRVEASHSSSTSANDSLPLYLIQLGPLLFVQDSTLLLHVHLSKQHLLWYGYDRKNGVHSLCPAIWSKHRRWLMMSMMCLNPVACSFMDLQFPNGQLMYVAGEGITASGFVPLFGGLLQAHGKYPGETRVSFSCKFPAIYEKNVLVSYGAMVICQKGQNLMAVLKSQASRVNPLRSLLQMMMQILVLQMIVNLMQAIGLILLSIPSKRRFHFLWR